MDKNLTPHELTLYWLEEIVIGLDLCPFARHPHKMGLVRIIECESTNESDQLSFFLDELDHLQQTSSSKLSTTLISYINDQSDFSDFNDFVGLCEETLIEAGLVEHFQLLVFHPQFLLADEDPLHRSHWVGRSPYPTIHLLRNAEIEIALESYADLIGIPARNEQRLLNLKQLDFDKLFYYGT